MTSTLYHEFGEAAGVLEVISKSPEGRRFYEARTKFLHSEEARLIAARQRDLEEGMEQGLEKAAARGSLRGKIQVLRGLLTDEETQLQDLLQQGDEDFPRSSPSHRDEWHCRASKSLLQDELRISQFGS